MPPSRLGEGGLTRHVLQKNTASLLMALLSYSHHPDPGMCPYSRMHICSAGWLFRIFRSIDNML